MKYRVVKAFFCPILKRRVAVNEEVEVKDEYLDGYKPYIEIKEVKKEIKKEIKEEVIEKAVVEVKKETAIKPKKKK